MSGSSGVSVSVLRTLGSPGSLQVTPVFPAGSEERTCSAAAALCRPEQRPADLPARRGGSPLGEGVEAAGAEDAGYHARGLGLVALFLLLLLLDRRRLWGHHLGLQLLVGGVAVDSRAVLRLQHARADQ